MSAGAGRGNYGGSYWDYGKSSQSTPDAAINTAVQGAIDDALQNFAPLQFDGEYPKGGFGISVLRPKDLAVTNQAAVALQSSVFSSILWGPISATTASVWSDWINLNIDNRLYVIVTGVWYAEPTPNITAIRMKANGEDLPTIDIEELQTYDVGYMFLEKPIIVKPGNALNVRYVPAVTKTTRENIGLLGYSLAKRAYLITE
jgi:hypothetical protein